MPTTARLSVLAALLAACSQSPAPIDAATDVAADAVDVTDAQSATPDAPDAAEPDPTPYQGPDDWCPGRSHCMGQGDGRLYVGAARALINPTIVEGEWDDRDGDHSYTAGEPFTDVNHNGRFDATWMAGFGPGRPATGMHDDLEVRALALRVGDTTVALAVIDCVGLFNTEMERIRADPMVTALGVDKVIIASTHVHEAVDTIGLWGEVIGRSGLNPTYQSLVRQRTAEALRDAVGALRPARMRVAQVVTVDAMGSTLDYVNDTRDPVIFDPTVTAVQFVDDATPTRTLATWVNWAAHPEYSGSRNNLLSADYVHSLRETIERGYMRDSLPGLGGITVFQNGALGGQVGPGGGTHVHDNDTGMTLTDSGIPKAQAAGVNVARLALAALARDGVEASNTDLSYRTAEIYARVENLNYAIGYQQHVFDRELLRYDPTRRLGPGNYAWVRSRVTYLQVGPVATITAPGELHPELWVGFDARWSWGRPRTSETANPPDFSMAPQAPFLRDLMLANPGVRYAFVSGLTEDFLGYIVPAYNYALHPTVPYILEAEGDHYEETNSIGPEAERFCQHPMLALARWRAPTSP